MRLLVINVAGLSRELVRGLSSVRSYPCQALLALSFPALTIPMQATLTTGVPPCEHGMIANGIYDKDHKQVRFWEQSEDLLKVPRFWSWPDHNLKVAMLFWQNSKFSDADYVVTPSPVHTDKEVILSCYSKPYEIQVALEEMLGPFPLHNYWGPMAGPKSSEWIMNCACFVLETFTPELTLTYIPLLDYSLQRYGPDSRKVKEDLKILDSLIQQLYEVAKKIDAETVILSEYAMDSVSASIDINKEFRRQGWIAVRDIKSQEFIELGDCKAFGMVDHQICHVYIKDLPTEEVVDFVRSLDKKMQIISTEEEKRELKINHERSGDVILVAPQERWFSYPWWLDNSRAPFFARAVDIHRKPGYDPLELFWDHQNKGVSFDTSLVKGSHGRLPDNDNQMGVYISSVPLDRERGSVQATEVPSLLLSILQAKK